MEGLNDNYESMIDQIMMLAHLPDLDRAYSLIVQVENRKMLSQSQNDHNHMMSMHVGQGFKNITQKPTSFKPGPFNKRLYKEEKWRLKFTHCLEPRHGAYECFKLHGIPKWYKKYRENKMTWRVNLVEGEDDGLGSQGAIDQSSTDMSKLIQAEVVKYVGNYFH